MWGNTPLPSSNHTKPGSPHGANATDMSHSNSSECRVLLTAFWGPRPDGKTILLPCNSWSPLEHWTSHLKDSRVTQVAWERSQSEGLGIELKYKLFRRSGWPQSPLKLYSASHPKSAFPKGSRGRNQRAQLKDDKNPWQACSVCMPCLGRIPWGMRIGGFSPRPNLAND